jgi:hypothetical protein
MMNDLLSSPSTRRGLLLAGILLLALVAAVAVRELTRERPSPVAVPTTAKTYPGLNLEDPEPSFEALRYVVETGGDARTREMAIVWLDRQAHGGKPLHTGQMEWLLEMLRHGGHPVWDAEFRFWIFNSAFNTLQNGCNATVFAQLLMKLAHEDPHRTMRLYALQHIGLQRSAGRLTGELADGIEADLRVLAAAPDGEVAGTAIALLAEWGGENVPADIGILAHAVEIAADDSRPVDVRVTALHAAAAQALPLARKLAGNSKQPVLLRKAAIGCIGIYGGETDFPALETLSGESSRLAQAADPAMNSIRRRLSNPDALAPVPF